MTAEPDRLRIKPGELGHITFIRELVPLWLAEPTEAARFLGVKRHSLACYRSLGEGPPYYKFGRWIRYAWADLRHYREGAAALTMEPSDTGRNDMALASPELAARYLGVTRACLSNYRIEGQGPRYCRLGRRILYPVGELRSWASQQYRPTAPPHRRPPRPDVAEPADNRTRS
jgi:hypothetical protein